MLERESDGVLQRAVLGFAGLRGPAVPMPAGGTRPVCRSTLALAVVGACLGALGRETDKVLRVLQRLGWGCTAGGRRAHGSAAGFSPIPSGHARRRLSGRATERCYVWSQGMAPSRPATCAEPVPGAGCRVVVASGRSGRLRAAAWTPPCQTAVVQACPDAACVAACRVWRSQRQSTPGVGLPRIGPIACELHKPARSGDDPPIPAAAAPTALLRWWSARRRPFPGRCGAACAGRRRVRPG